MNGLVLFVWWDNGVEPINADSYPKWKNTIRLRVPVAMDAQAKRVTRGYISSSECGFAFFFPDDGNPTEQTTRDEKEGERTGEHRSNCSQSKWGGKRGKDSKGKVNEIELGQNDRKREIKNGTQIDRKVKDDCVIQ